MDRHIFRSFNELRQTIDRMLLLGVLGQELHLRAEITPEMAEDPHTIMLLTWLEMQNG